FTQADIGVVTSERDRQWVIQNYNLPPEKIHRIPNYVVTDVFRPLPEITKKYDLVCVAKASSQKNLSALLTAMALCKKKGQAFSLLLIGSAAQDDAITKQIEDLQLDVTRLPRVTNFELPTFLNQARCFILPSLYEGHPKALLEAMSCGLPCIGTDVIGIQDDLIHGETGYLCQTDPSSLASAIQVVLSDDQLQKDLANGAHKYILSHYSLDVVVELEKQLYKEMLF
ncbi:MAG: glycosyltransferase family 4 protein, partial [Chloroflexota bacterium]